jgi:hypothetical protein
MAVEQVVRRLPVSRRHKPALQTGGRGGGGAAPLFSRSGDEPALHPGRRARPVLLHYRAQ